MYRCLGEGHMGFGMIDMDYRFLRRNSGNVIDYKLNHDYQTIFTKTPLSTQTPG